MAGGTRGARPETLEWPKPDTVPGAPPATSCPPRGRPCPASRGASRDPERQCQVRGLRSAPACGGQRQRCQEGQATADVAQRPSSGGRGRCRVDGQWPSGAECGFSRARSHFTKSSRTCGTGRRAPPRAQGWGCCAQAGPSHVAPGPGSAAHTGFQAVGPSRTPGRPVTLR